MPLYNFFQVLKLFLCGFCQWPALSGAWRLMHCLVLGKVCVGCRVPGWNAWADRPPGQHPICRNHWRSMLQVRNDFPGISTNQATVRAGKLGDWDQSVSRNETEEPFWIRLMWAGALAWLKHALFSPPSSWNNFFSALLPTCECSGQSVEDPRSHYFPIKHTHNCSRSKLSSDPFSGPSRALQSPPTLWPTSVSRLIVPSLFHMLKKCNYDVILM